MSDSLAPHAAQQQQQQQKDEQQRAPEVDRPPRQQQQNAVAAVQAYLGRRPGAAQVGALLARMQSEGRLSRGDLSKVAELLARQCGNAFAREALAPVQAKGGGPPQQVRKPQTLQEHRQAGTVRRDFMPGQLSFKLHNALDRFFADKPAIYAVLEGCNKVEAELLRRTYRNVYKRDLLEHLDDKLNGADLRRAWAPFGKAGDVPETTTEWIGRKASEAYRVQKQGLETMADMASIVKDLRLNPITMEGTVTVDVGKAFYYLAPHLPPHLATMFSVDPSARVANKVALYVNLKQGVAHLHARQLAVRGMHYPSFFSGPCTLNKVDLQLRNFNPLKPQAAGTNGFASIGSAMVANPVFTSRPLDEKGPRQMVHAKNVLLTGLHANASKVANLDGGGADGLVSSLSFSSAQATGIKYPGMPPVDVDVRQAGLTFDSLWDVLGQTGDKDQDEGDGGIPTAPSLLPPDSRIKVALDGVHGGASYREGASGGAGFKSCRIALLHGGKETAAIDLKGFKAQVDSKGRVGGSLKSLMVNGEPELVRALAASQELMAAPQVRTALKLLKQFGLQDALTAQAKLSNLVFDHDAQKDSAKGDLNATLAVEGIGSVALDLTGFEGAREGERTQAGFDNFSARLLDEQGAEVAAVLIDGPARGKQDQQGATLSVGKVTTRGSGERLGDLFAALKKQVGALPAGMQEVFGLVRSYGDAFGLEGEVGLDGLTVNLGPDGKVKAGGTINGSLELDGVGAIELSVDGVQTQQDGAAAALDFDSLRAKLVRTGGQQVASLAIKGGRGHEVETDGKTTRMRARQVGLKGDSGEVALLLKGLRERGGDLPGLKEVLDTAQDYLPMLESLDADAELKLNNLGVRERGGQITASSDLSGKVEAEGLGTIGLDLKGYQGNPANPQDVQFDKLEATLKDASGKEAAFFGVHGVRDRSDEPDFGRGKGMAFAIDKVEVRGSSKQAAAMLKALEKRFPSLPAGAKAAFDIAKKYGSALDVGANVDLSGAEIDVRGGDVELRGDLQTRITIEGVGALVVSAEQLQIGTNVVNFDRFRTRLLDEQGQELAALDIQSDRDEAERVAKQGGNVTKFGRASLTGGTKRIGRLVGALREHGPALPGPLRRSLANIETFLSGYDVEGSVSFEDLKLERDEGRTNLSFRVPVAGDSVLTQALEEGSQINVALDGFMAGGNEVGFDRLQVGLQDKQGRSVASLQVSGVHNLQEGEKGQVRVESVNVEGDGRLLKAALSPSLLAGLGPEVRAALDAIKDVRFSGTKGQLDYQASGGYAGRFADLSLSGSVALSDGKGNMYQADGAALTVAEPQVQLDDQMRLRQLEAASLHGKAQLVRDDGKVQVAGDISARGINVRMGPDGKPQSFEAADIRAAGNVEGGAELLDNQQQKNEQVSAAGDPDQMAAQAKAAAAMVKDASIHTSTPLKPGRYGLGFGELEVPTGTELNTNLVIQNRRIVTGSKGTGVSFSQGLGGPLWIKVKGAYLEQAGQKGVMRANLGGFFDLNVSKALAGKKNLSLQLTELVDEVMAAQRAAVESKTPSDIRKDERKRAKAEEKLRRNRADWQEDVADDKADYEEDLADLDEDRAEWAAKLARKRSGASERDLTKLAEKDRKKQSDFNRKLAKLQAGQAEDMEEFAEEEPRTADAAELFGPKGMDIAGTKAKADVTLASQGGKDRELAPGVVVPGDQEVRLHGQGAGGKVNLRANGIEALLYGHSVQASGLQTGDVALQPSEKGTAPDRISFSSFYLRKLSWKAPEDAKKKRQ